MINGQNNIIKIIENNTEKIVDDTEIEGLRIEIKGSNNTIIIELPTKFIKSSIKMCGDNNFCHIKASNNRSITDTLFWFEDGGRTIFGSNISVAKNLKINSKCNRSIEIGDNCMFAQNIVVRNNDGHIILDKDTNEVINKPEDIKIGNNVWVGGDVTILKGSVVPSGSVIGAMSLVNKKFQKENCIIAGNPAKIVKENIIWQRQNYYSYLKNHPEIME